MIKGHLSLPVDSKPSRPVKEGVSLKRSITLAIKVDGIFGAGPPPVFFCSFASSLYSFLASPLLANFGCSPHCHTNSVYGIGDFFPHFIFFLIGNAVGKLTLYQRKVFFDFFGQNGNF